MKLVVLGLSGVIITPREDGDWATLPGAVEAVARLNHLGFHVVVACNLGTKVASAIGLDDQGHSQRRLHSELQRVGGHLDGLFFCPHSADAGCDCHLPRPGLLHEIGKRLLVRLSGIPVICSDQALLEASLGVDAQPVLVRTGSGANAEMSVHAAGDLPVFDDLEAAVVGMFR